MFLDRKKRPTSEIPDGERSDDERLDSERPDSKGPDGERPPYSENLRLPSRCVTHSVRNLHERMKTSYTRWHVLSTDYGMRSASSRGCKGQRKDRRRCCGTKYGPRQREGDRLWSLLLIIQIVGHFITDASDVASCK
jgi:hypothetical protein